ncbi:MAG: cyclic nucleotide-binding domain-containing protein [Paracoccaceae bacterium]
MSLARTLDVMRRMPLFQSLDDRRLRVLAMTGEALTLRAGERLWERGDEGDSAVIVIEGAVDILMPGEDGEQAIAQLGAGEVIGEMAVLTGNPRSTAVAARTDLRVLRLDGDTLIGLLREYPELSLSVIKVLADRLEATNAKVV